MTEVIPLPLQQSLIQPLLPLFGAFIPARHHAINHDDSYFFRPFRKNFTLIAPQPSLRKIGNCQMCGPSRIIHPAFARIFPRIPTLSNVRILKFHFQQSRMSAGIGFEAVEKHSFFEQPLDRNHAFDRICDSVPRPTGTIRSRLYKNRDAWPRPSSLDALRQFTLCSRFL